MIKLTETFNKLPVDKKRFVHRELIEHALVKWERFAALSRSIAYKESISGTKQTVDMSLPSDAIRSVRDGRDVADVGKRYCEPITALHDQDLKFPEHIEYAYYAIYNTFNRYVKNEKIDDWLIVNQSLSSENDETKWKPLLRTAIKKAVQHLP